MLPTQKTKKAHDFQRMNTVIYGLPKVGKTTFASQIPGALFLTTEEGYNHVEIFNHKITKWDDVYTVAKALNAEKHNFKTIVIDIADWWYKHCENFVMLKNGVNHPSDLAYGKGYSLVKDEFIRVVNGLNQMGFGLIFVSHAKEREMSTKTSKWTYMDTSMQASASQVICGLADFIFYFYIDAEGKRMIRTKPTKFINAGDRSGKLPELMTIDYTSFIKTFNETIGGQNGNMGRNTKSRVEGVRPVTEGQVQSQSN